MTGAIVHISLRDNILRLDTLLQLRLQESLPQHRPEHIAMPARKAKIEKLEVPGMTSLGEPASAQIPLRPEDFRNCCILTSLHLISSMFDTVCSYSITQIQRFYATAEQKLLLTNFGGLPGNCKPKMDPLPAPSVLARLQNFLPALDKANLALAKQSADAVSMELKGDTYVLPSNKSFQQNHSRGSMLPFAGLGFGPCSVTIEIFQYPSEMQMEMISLI